jgi:hypothetical protein
MAELTRADQRDEARGFRARGQDLRHLSSRPGSGRRRQADGRVSASASDICSTRCRRQLGGGSQSACRSAGQCGDGDRHRSRPGAPSDDLFSQTAGVRRFLRRRDADRSIINGIRVGGFNHQCGQVLRHPRMPPAPACLLSRPARLERVLGPPLHPGQRDRARVSSAFRARLPPPRSRSPSLRSRRQAPFREYGAAGELWKASPSFGAADASKLHHVQPVIIVVSGGRSISTTTRRQPAVTGGPGAFVGESPRATRRRPRHCAAIRYRRAEIRDVSRLQILDTSPPALAEPPTRATARDLGRALAFAG